MRGQVAARSGPATMFSEGDIGVLPPLGVWDPLGYIDSRDMRRYEEMESRGAASRRRRTKYTKNNKKPRRVRRQGGSCSRAQSLQSTCVPTLTVMPPCPPRAGFECRYKPVSYEWIPGMTRTMLECCEAEREIYYVR